MRRQKTPQPLGRGVKIKASRPAYSSAKIAVTSQVILNFRREKLSAMSAEDKLFPEPTELENAFWTKA